MTHDRKVQRTHWSAGTEKTGAPEPTAKSTTPSGAPQWAGSHTGAPFPLTGVQREAKVGPTDDKFEREARSVGSQVASGQSIAPGTISRLTTESPTQRDCTPAASPEALCGGVQKCPSDTQRCPDVQKDDKPPTEPQKTKPAVQRTEAPKEKQKSESPKIQKAEAPREKPKSESPKVQKAEAPKEKPKSESPKVQKTEAPKEKPKSVQKAPRGGAKSPAAMNAAAGRAVGTRGAGEPMHPSTRSALESRMGTDLSGVRVHDTPTAREQAADIDARAFTHGRDIWLGPGESQHDLGLMAHEATHVVQQGAAPGAQMVRREPTTPAPTASVPATPAAPGISGNTITIPELHIPKFKEATVPKDQPVTLTQPKARTNQTAEWRKYVTADVAGALKTKLDRKKGIRPAPTGGADAAAKPVATSGDDPKALFFFEVGGGNYLIGTEPEIATTLEIPRWDDRSKSRLFDVDHFKELQLGGEPSDPNNFWLLDAPANRSSGSIIAQEIRSTIEKAVQPEVGPGKRWDKTPSVDEVRQAFTITYNRVVADITKIAGDPTAVWRAPDVKSLLPFDKLKPLGPDEVVSKNLLGSPTSLLVYVTPGAKPKRLPWNVKTPSIPLSDEWLRGLTKATISYDKGKGSITGTVFGKDRVTKLMVPKQRTFDLVDFGDFPFTTVIPKGLLPSMKFGEFYPMSQIEFEDVTVDDAQGIVARGTVRPSMPFLQPGLEIDISVSDAGVTLSKTFTKDNFKIPSPFKVPSASLTVEVSTGSWVPKLKGDVSLEIERLGKGQVHAELDAKGKLALAGTFDFDKTVFQPARGTVTYQGEKFGFAADIGIPAGKVPGIQSALFHVGYVDETFSGSGDITPSIPGVKKGKVSVTYGEKEGVIIGAEMDLKDDIPGVAGGNMKATLSKKPDADHFAIKASGSAKPKIPGVDTELGVTYDDGMFDIHGVVSYAKGMLSGTVTVGATNRSIGPDGVPAAEAPKDAKAPMHLYGSGSVKLKLAPWLEAKAGIRFFDPDEVEVVGEISLPSAIDLFPRKEFSKELVHVNLPRISILGFSVAGHSVGIYLQVGGGVTLNAGIGPVQLVDVHLGVTYNPKHEDQTHVTGGARLHVPANAGVDVSISADIGVGIPLVDASAGLTIGGGLGVKASADACVNVDWTPAQGLVVDACAAIVAEPTLHFFVEGHVLVELDLLLKTIELYSNKWSLADITLGSGLKLGVALPVHYDEGKGFSASLEDAKYTVPEIKPGEIFEHLWQQIKDS